MSQIQEESRQVTMSINEMILIQLRDLKDSQHEMNNRMDRIERRMDKLEDKIENLDKKFDSKIDRLASKIDTSSNHGQIATISTVGIALGVLYTLFFK